MLRSKNVLSAVIAGLALTSGVVFAQVPDPVEVYFTVLADIPSGDFFVQPKGQWNFETDALRMIYRNGDLQQISGFDLEAKSTYGKIEAKLAYPPVISSSGNIIPLVVALNGKTLETGAPTEIYTEEDKGNIKSISMVIDAEKPVDGYVAGRYAGAVNMNFETRAP